VVELKRTWVSSSRLRRSLAVFTTNDAVCVGGTLDHFSSSGRRGPPASTRRSNIHRDSKRLLKRAVDLLL